MSAAIRLDNLSKTYANEVVAVNQLNFEVEQGQIYGFLGPNGAGKTTTIRMLLNLIYPTAGAVYLFDTPMNKAHNLLKTKIGALVEEATFYPFMSGRDNLRTLAYTCEHYDTSRIERVLAMVGLSEYAERKVKAYSTGMKQRLGVAAALLNNPDLIILDEPTSGLDPKGIQEMRHMLKHLAENERKTIFLSSHLLNEVEQICDRIAIIQKGQLIREGRVAELLHDELIVQISVQPLEPALRLLESMMAVRQVNGLLEIDVKHEDIPAIINKLVSENMSIYQVTQKRRTLEDLFLEVTHG